MEIVLTSLLAGMDLLYGWVLFSSFFSCKRSKEDTVWFLLLSWMAVSAYSIFVQDAVSPVLVRLLSLVLMLTILFRENGPRGLGVLLAGFTLELIPELLVRSLPQPFFSQRPRQ